MNVKGYFRIDDVDYFGYSVKFIGKQRASWRAIDSVCTKNIWLSGESDIKMEGLCSYKATPPKGSSVYFLGPCDYARDEIARNYNIKRSEKDAKYLVVTYTLDSWESCADCNFIICPDTKIAYVAQQGEMSLDYLKTVVASERADGTANCIFREDFRLFFYRDTQRLFDALFANTTNTVWWKNLNTGSGNDLTLDALQLLWEVGKKSDYSDTALNNVALEINAINAFDWRRYPHTISIMQKMLSGFKYGSYRKLASVSSRYPKPVRNFTDGDILMPDEKLTPEERQKDAELGRAFLSRVLEMDNRKFVSFKDLCRKLNSVHIYCEDFEYFYDCVTRITPKAIDNEQKN